ncbi:extracellular solute-binding protein [Acidisphaera sp. L21]|uniref:extracellular solute-binding protein n=1 Tax=Acidisphaera sp. L21 TaxID=1641851 RepID=UPI00131CAD02|nr:extracellular solute-binding protein [Acidisphaera sp. L21]
MLLRAALAALFVSSAIVHGAHAQEKVLNVYNWTDYIDPAALERFKKETGIEVHYDVYDSLETLEGKMLAGHSGYDVIVPTAEPTFSRLIAAGALQPLDRGKIPAMAGEDPALLKRVETSDPGNKYGAIYLWGTIGLGEVASKIKPLMADAPLDSWDLLLKPENAKKLAPCGITMMDSATDVIPSVLKYLHHDPASTDPKDLADVEKTLMAIRPYIRTFASGGAIEALAAGQTCLVMSYSGDVIQASARAAEAKRDAVTYVAPKEFTQLWFDMLAVPKDAPHAALAMQFINFILQPGTIAGVTNTVHYPNAVPASRDKVDPAVRDDPNVYPDAAALGRSFTVAAVKEAAVRARTRMWAKFKAGH